MELAHKVILGAMVPATFIWAVSFYATTTAENGLHQAIEWTSAACASAVMDEIDQVMHTRIAEWKTYVRSQVAEQALRASNREFEYLENREQYIEEQDREWRAAPKGKLTPFMKRLIDNQLANDLRLRLAKLEQANGYAVFGEVFMTNRYGANVAQTNRTTDYRQDDEDWWRLAMRDGQYVADVGFDESAGVFFTDICVRIDDERGSPLGVLKVVHNIQEVINIIDARSTDPRSGGYHRLILFTADHRIIRAGSVPEPPLANGSRYFDGVELPLQEHIFTVQRHDRMSGQQLLSAYAVSHGHGGFKGLGWVLLLEYDAEDVLRPVYDLRNNILLIALCATLLALGLGGAVALAMSRRIKRLAKATVALGKGDLDPTIRVKGTDELAQLEASFCQMARDLNRATEGLREQADVVRQKNRLLEQEIGERKRAEEVLEVERRRLFSLLDRLPAFVYLQAPDYSVRFANRRFCENFGDPEGRRCYEVLWGAKEPCKACPTFRVFDTNSPQEWEWTHPATGRTYQIYDYPFADTDGSRLVLEMGVDITDRKILEGQLVQAQKMESIGQLAAGIAHEINTPTQYVSDNIRFLQDSVRDLLKALDRCGEMLDPVKGPSDWDKRIAEFEAALHELDIEFLRAEIPKAIDQSLEGLERVTRIVRAMKDFSHPGGEGKKAVDLNKAIESTITVARNEWKYVAEMVTEFDPFLPAVPCLVGDFNQVILNIVINAAHAIANVVGDNTGKKGAITITTRRDGGWAEIRISDTGTGIPPEHRSKVFDHFFTTKEVGKGTGQGLAIAHAVVTEKHGGTITFETKVGQGTTFVIRLPIEPESAAAEEMPQHEEAYSLR